MEKKVNSVTTVLSDTTTYVVGDLLARSSSYRLYFADDLSSGSRQLLQVSTSVEHNGSLDRAAFLLGVLRETADKYDAAYAKSGTSGRLHYERLYPRLMESFLSTDNDSMLRRINILSLANIDDIGQVVPLSSLRTKFSRRLDPETSAWIMGRLLKLAAFIHENGITNRALTGNNVLLHPENHYAITLDWSAARMSLGHATKASAADDIQTAATAVFRALGGSVANQTWSYEDHRPYIELLKRLMSGRETDANHALDRFYELVRAEYGNSFHPFTTLPL